MGRSITFGLLVASLFMLADPSSLLAQCSWCTTVTDVCCDGNFSSVDYTLPCNTSEIWVYYDAPGNDRVHVIITDVSGGGSIPVAEQNIPGSNCDCTRYRIYTGGINAGHVLRFKISCVKCSTNQTSCDSGTASVTFFTPVGNLCAPFCQ